MRVVLRRRRNSGSEAIFSQAVSSDLGGRDRAVCVVSASVSEAGLSKRQGGAFGLVLVTGFCLVFKGTSAKVVFACIDEGVLGCVWVASAAWGLRLEPVCEGVRRIWAAWLLDDQDVGFGGEGYAEVVAWGVRASNVP